MTSCLLDVYYIPDGKGEGLYLRCATCHCAVAHYKSRSVSAVDLLKMMQLHMKAAAVARGEAS